MVLKQGQTVKKIALKVERLTNKKKKKKIERQIKGTKKYRQTEELKSPLRKKEDSLNEILGASEITANHIL